MKAQMGDKLAASVRGAKKQQAEAKPAVTAPADAATEVVVEVEAAPAVAASSQADAVKVTLPLMTRRRVWPD